MENITIEHKNCIFLNHEKLIRDIYQRHIKSNFSTYSLKQEIFNYKPKTSSSISAATTTSNTKQLKNLNRKRKIDDKNELYIALQPFIKQIQQRFLVLPQFEKDLPRTWEDQHEFPQFCGGNSTHQYQITKFGQQDYIIPPKTKFFNHNIENLTKLLPELETYDLLIMDMPWQNKYIKRLKKVKTSLAYQMLDNGTLKNMPISHLIHKNSLVVLWCTNARQHRKAVTEEFLPKWNLQLVHKLKWFKINTIGELISPIKPEGFKQPYEIIYIACSKQKDVFDFQGITKVDFLISIPSIIHSHKPPLAEWLKNFLPNSENFKGLEIFARYLQPQFTSIGLEVLKLMDIRLYNIKQETEEISENNSC